MRRKALWVGWMGTAVSVASWLALWQIGSASVAVWVGLMSAAAVLCAYGALRASRWFWAPAIVTTLVTAGAIWAASRPEP